MVDEGETPEEAARRELREETGYEAERWTELGHVLPNPAIQMNRTYTYLARGARRVGDPEFDGTEDCRLVLRPWSDAHRLVREGRIRHSLVVAALHWETLRRMQ
jgi:8-oxo-dGTP pyrophosphatase MutT (NUDIX family)